MQRQNENPVLFFFGVFAFGILFAGIGRLVCVGLSAPGKNAVLDFAALSGAVQGKYPGTAPGVAAAIG